MIRMIVIILIGLAATVLSVIWMVSAIVIQRKRNIMDYSWQLTTAKKIGTERMPSGLVRQIYAYSVNGVEYQWKSKPGHDNVREFDKEIKILYNPQNHSEASAVKRAPMLRVVIAAFVSGAIGIFLLFLVSIRLGLLVFEGSVGHVFLFLLLHVLSLQALPHYSFNSGGFIKSMLKSKLL